jgi:hypothetical protein
MKLSGLGWIQDSLSLAATLHSIFEQLGVLYYITGGVASSTFGDPRTTRRVTSNLYIYVRGESQACCVFSGIA